MSEGTPPPPPSENPYGSPPPQGGTPPPPPPPPGGYAPPPSDLPPPAQPGGYSPAPPPPPAAPGSGGYDPVEAFKYGWTKFTQNAGQFILATVLVIVVGAVFSFLGQLIAAALFNTNPTTTVDPDTGQVSVEGGGVLVGFLANGLVSFIGQVVSALLVAGLLKMAFDAVAARPVSVSTMFEGWDKVQLLVAALITSLLTAVGLVLCILPGIVIAVLTGFTTAFVVDAKLGAVDAIKASFNFVKNNVGAVLLWILLAFVCVFLGAIACLVGLLVAIPVVTISQAYTVRVLHGLPVSPATSSSVG